MAVKKLLTVIGTRPEAIKLAPVIKAIKLCPTLRCCVCVTAQHRQMLDQVLEIYGIKPDFDLNIMKTNQDLYDVTASVLSGMKKVLQEAQPDMVLVQGDTTTTFGASLAAFYQKISVGHVEAGLRTYNKYAPYPEEANRRMTSALADMHFAPTEWAKTNLIKEGIEESKTFVTGNTVVDALKEALIQMQNLGGSHLLNGELPFDIREKKYVLITGHRRESFGQGFKEICHAIKELAEAVPETEFVYPVHLNPNVRKPVNTILKKDNSPNIHLIDPLMYLPFILLMKYCHFILTDSGGIQEEALTFGKPVLVMRNTTERPEGIQVGAVKLVGNAKTSIVRECRKLLTSKSVYRSMVVENNPYGDGRAADRILNIITNSLCC